jgi:hypothetical protein
VAYWNVRCAVKAVQRVVPRARLLASALSLCAMMGHCLLATVRMRCCYCKAIVVEPLATSPTCAARHSSERIRVICETCMQGNPCGSE